MWPLRIVQPLHMHLSFFRFLILFLGFYMWFFIASLTMTLVTIQGNSRGRKKTQVNIQWHSRVSNPGHFCFSLMSSGIDCKGVNDEVKPIQRNEGWLIVPSQWFSEHSWWFLDSFSVMQTWFVRKVSIGSINMVGMAG